MIFAPGLLLEDRLGQERRREVAGDELARVVDEEAAVGVPVEGDAEVGALLERLLHDELAVLRQQRVRLVVREGAVRVEVAADGVDRQTLQDGREHRAAHPVGGVDHDAERLDLFDVDERRGRGRRKPARCRKTESFRGLQQGSDPGFPRAQRPVADVQQPRFAADGQRAFADDLHPRVLLRVVRGGDGDAAVEAERADREIDHLGADHSEVEYLGAAPRPAPDMTALAIDGAETRMSRPTAIRFGSNCAA